MKFSALKELLLKKANSDELKLAVSTSMPDLIEDIVIESLQKMAVKKSKGSKANNSLVDIGRKDLDVGEGEESITTHMLRDALGHHASRYKKALELGDNNMVDRHARNFFKLLDFAHMLEPHSKGSLKVSAVPLQAWERNIPGKDVTYAEAMARDPKYKEKVSNWHLRPGSDGKLHRALVSPDSYKIVDSGFDIWREHPKKTGWDFLQKEPAERLKYEAAKHGHRGAYPMEDTKINNKHIPIEDVENLYDDQADHPFDLHPIFKPTKSGDLTFKVSSEHRDPQDDVNFISEKLAYNKSPHAANFKNKLRSLSSRPDFETMGSEKGSPVHGEKTVYQHPSTIDFKAEFPKKGRFFSSQPETQEPSVPEVSSQLSVDKQKIPEHLHDLLEDKPKINKEMLPKHLHDLLDD